MMERRDAQNFPTENFFAEHLQDVGKNGDHQQQRDDRQDADSPAAAERVGEERYHGKGERKRHGACLRQIKARRRDVKPQERQQASGYCRRQSRDVHLVLKEGDARVRGKYRGKRSSCKAVDAVDDAARVDKKSHKRKERYDERAELKRAV